MSDDIITNAVLLQHMQGMKNDLQSQITTIDKKLDGLTTEMRQGFKDVRERQDTMQEDLDASIRMLGKHEATLARL